jgi:hypothetical protein
MPGETFGKPLITIGEDSVQLIDPTNAGRKLNYSLVRPCFGVKIAVDSGIATPDITVWTATSNWYLRSASWVQRTALVEAIAGVCTSAQILRQSAPVDPSGCLLPASGRALDFLGYSVEHVRSGSDHGLVEVTNACIFFEIPRHPEDQTWHAPCHDPERITLERGSVRVGKELFLPDGPTLTVDTLLRGIEAACQTQTANRQHKAEIELARAKAEAEREVGKARAEAEARAAEVEAKRAEAEAIAAGEAMRQRESVAREERFRDRILAVLHAAEEPDSFASIRGEFDLSASDSRHWKTSFKLPEAEECVLLNTSSSTPTSGLSWTFGCKFRVPTEGYERMVKRIQSVLNIPYRPDERANVNQVFFSDPSKPMWRLFVRRISKDVVGVSIPVVRLGDTAQVPDTFPTNPGMWPTESDVPGGAETSRFAQSQTTATPVECEEYQRREREMASRVAEVRRIGLELTALQLNYQNATQKALENEQRANAAKASGKGLLAALAAVGSMASSLSAQESRAEAQKLQVQMTLKQSEFTTAQSNLLASPATAPRAGCLTTPPASAIDVKAK